MHFLVDGHNLIPKIPGLSLSDPEDELRLIQLLQEYSRLSRDTVEIYFDRAAPGSLPTRQYGTVKAHFVGHGRTADQVIIARLRRLGKAAAAWTVVSSDHQVQVDARAVRARVMNSESFSRHLLKQLEASAEGELRDVSVNEEELSTWLRVFGASEEENS